MNMLVILPNHIAAEIDRRLDEAIAECPGSEVERADLRAVLVGYFNEHGALPEFVIARRDPQVLISTAPASEEDGP